MPEAAADAQSAEMPVLRQPGVANNSVFQGLRPAKRHENWPELR